MGSLDKNPLAVKLLHNRLYICFKSSFWSAPSFFVKFEDWEGGHLFLIHFVSHFVCKLDFFHEFLTRLLTKREKTKLDQQQVSFWLKNRDGRSLGSDSKLAWAWAWATFRMSVLHYTKYLSSKIQDQFRSPNSDTVCPTFNSISIDP